MNLLTNSSFAERCREAYRKSSAWKAIHVSVRQPGEDQEESTAEGRGDLAKVDVPESDPVADVSEYKPVPSTLEDRWVSLSRDPLEQEFMDK